MRRLVCGLALILGGWLCWPLFAHGQGAANPLWSWHAGGKAAAVTEVACATTAGGTALLAATATANTVRLTFRNIDATNFVDICPVAAGTCTAATGIKLLANAVAGSVVVVENSRGVAWSCLGNGGTVTVEVLNEKYG